MYKKRCISILVISQLLLLGCSTSTIKETSLTDSSDSVIKVVQVSDIHYKSNENKFDKMIANINRINPDLFVITGDLIDDKTQVDNFITCFSKLTISCPKFAILGNWEYWSNVNIQELKSQLLTIGIVLLINENRIISIKNKIVQVYGVDDYLGGKPDFDGLHLLNNQVNIILAHCPILFEQIINLEEINNLQKVLVLSGHTHGGQITFFGIPLKKPEGSGDYTSGIYKKKNYILNVSRGIGNSIINIRVFSPSTIEVIEI